MLLIDKTAIVTGGGSGLGEATCKLFAANGCKVVVADYNFDEAKRVSDEINAAGGESFAAMVDVSKRECVRNIVTDVIHFYGRVDILINNAGITRDAMLKKLTYEDFDKVIDTNLTGVFNMTKEVIPHMLEQGYGRIINTSSVVGVDGNVGQTNYAAAKAAVNGMMKVWAKELGPKGINVNSVAPGFIATPMTVGKMKPEHIAAVESKIPLKRLGKPIDIANAYLYLASDMANYVNGTVLEVNGGLKL